MPNAGGSRLLTAKNTKSAKINIVLNNNGIVHAFIAALSAYFLISNL